MILYYAMGGGLGHLSRTIAILNEAPELHGKTRIMTSSRLTPMVKPHSPCPMDYIRGAVLESRKRYFDFLSDYITFHRIRLIVLDTFPFGIVGEWFFVDPGIPRILIARDLKWPVYLNKFVRWPLVFPSKSIAVEPLIGQYQRVLEKNSELTVLNAPILLEQAQSGPRNAKGVIIHSGSDAECRRLEKFARQSGIVGDMDTVYADKKIYPAEKTISAYRFVVSGCGYNMAAIASQSPPERKHLLMPFKRKYDNQFLRLNRLKKGLWRDKSSSGAPMAAEWLTDALC